VAGPILRWSGIAPQLARRAVSREQFAEGVRRFVGGLAKKVIIANAVAVPADQIFALGPDELSTPVAWFGIVCYSLQIYFDFSGYSDMAVGLGKMFGFAFLENFDTPYIAQSLREFWRRWHISLSTWFRDYLYIPMGGNRGSELRTGANLLTVFFLCGLWHGASWTFVAWGLYHGLFLVLERTPFGAWLERLPRVLRHGYAIVVVMLGWVLFRADSFPAAWAYFGALSAWAPEAAAQPLARYASREAIWAVAAGVVFSAPIWAWLRARAGRFAHARSRGVATALEAGGVALETGLVVLLLVACAASLAGGTYNPFIYFRF
jgi:alginate O-acetyltransferase complex protein AlgI